MSEFIPIPMKHPNYMLLLINRYEGSIPDVEVEIEVVPSIRGAESFDIHGSLVTACGKELQKMATAPTTSTVDVMSKAVTKHLQLFAAAYEAGERWD